MNRERRGRRKGRGWEVPYFARPLLISFRRLFQPSTQYNAIQNFETRTRPVARHLSGGVRSRRRRRRGVWGVGRGHTPPHWGRGLGRGLSENFGSFSLEMAHFRANSVVYFKRNVRLFTARIMTVTVYCWRLAESSYWG